MEHVVQTDVDRYVIVEYLAEGGMGAIFLGKKIGMGGFEKDVVLKQLLPEFTSQPEFIDLFLREAKLSAALDHANIVHTIDLVKAGSDYFIVMEYIRGGDLRTILRRIKVRGFALAPAAAIFAAREVLSALAYAHEKKSADGVPLKLIHRDVSPSNIMVSAAGEVKLTDFGIAKASTHRSVFYRVKGKVGYMSPEQAYGDPLDLRSDLYSLAVCLYEMLSGERLFVADLLSTPDQIYSQPIRALEGSHPGIPHGLDRVMAKALAFNPDDRYQTALEFQDALVRTAYQSAMLFSAPDLAAHLREVCGEDASAWNKEPEDDAEESEGDEAGPGTEVLPEEGSAAFSGVELTSVFTGFGPPEESAAADSDEEETQYLTLAPHNLAQASTQFQSEQAGAQRNRRAPAPTFDYSDLPGNNSGIQRNGHSAGRHRPPAGAPHAHDWDDALSKAEGFPLPPDDSWAGAPAVPPDWSSEEQATVAHFSALPQPARSDSSEAETAMAGSRHAPLQLSEPRQHAIAESREREPRQIQRTAELRDGEWRRQRTPANQELQPLVTEHGQRILQDPGEEMPHERRQRLSQRLVIIISAAMLVLAGAAIIALVGLTGPNLEDPVKGQHKDPQVVAASSLDAAGSQFGLPDGAGARTAVPQADRASGLQGAQASDQHGSVNVNSMPTGAAVYLDDTFKCETPCMVEGLEDGRVYLLSIRRKSYVSWSSLFDLRGQRLVNLSVTLDEEPDPQKVGYLLVKSDPVAEVLVNNKAIGRVTGEGRIPLHPGQYEIALTRPHKLARPRYLVTILAGQTVLLNAKKF